MGFLRENFTEPIWHAGHLQKLGNSHFHGGGQNAKFALQQGPWETLERERERERERETSLMSRIEWRRDIFLSWLLNWDCLFVERGGAWACTVLYDLWGYGGRFFFFTCLILYTLVCRVFHVMHHAIIVGASRVPFVSKPMPLRVLLHVQRWKAKFTILTMLLLQRI
jgi:hypothetical protein